ncbi:hypothetical protein [Clostridium felsineum]|uniref:Uncharacterized protein n=1 Tax=Clostridium felsineum TaxID=36839 RepID=A0A1S8MF03_9CLOT|nr:hypothetical protein [Clostridium felsineum]URZ09240.1 hypothetical protein CLROS_046560 [Clostridium felsineum]URZ13926.1 hypothetical protein CROST_047040 [Clostridium felsineum]
MAKDLWRYYEGTSSAASFINDVAKVLCTGVKTQPIKDSNGNILKDAEVIQEKNWDIVFPKANKDKLDVMDWSSLTPKEFSAKINNQLEQVSDTIILKTKTTPKNLSTVSNVDDLNLEDDLSVKSTEMYVELYKPAYLADSEVYNPECERQGVEPYCITKDIYKEYASKYGSVEINLKDQFAGTDGLTLGTNDDVYSGSKQFTSSDSGTNQNECQNLLNRVNSIFGVSLLITGGEMDIPASSFSKLRGTDLEGIITSVTGIPTDQFSKYTKLAIKANNWQSGPWYDRFWCYEVVFAFHDVYETYVIPKGWRIELPEKDAVDVKSIVFKVGTTKKVYGNDWAFDDATSTFNVEKLISGPTRSLGDPVITYQYTKASTDISGRKLIHNNNYIYIRMFDIINDDLTGPIPDKIDDKTGSVLYVNSHTSQWSKLSWYQDFEEVMIDTLDSDSTEDDVTDGVINLPIEEPGLTSDTRIRFWINTNNDRALFVVMGNPSLDFSKNRHLISAAYIGQIESFENSINDTAGNFALFTSSSTTPCDTKTVLKRTTLSDSKLIGLGPLTSFKGITIESGKYFDTMGSFTIELSKDGSNTTTILKKGESFTISFSSDKTSADIELLTTPNDGENVVLKYDYYIEKYSYIQGIVRDGFGNIVETIYPDKWGKNTATGVTDISMFFTRSKAYFQKHSLMFTTTEEFMSKSLYGKSSYTDEYYADRLKITHGNDGPRGMLYDCLAIDTSSLYAFDELIVNRDFGKDTTKPEETYIFFPVTAPFSPFSTSPNANYGFAIKKQVKYPAPTTDDAAVDAALDNLSTQVGSLLELTDDVALPDTEANDVKITWSSDTTTVVEIQTV